jgi:hypothetical protein
MFGRDGDIHGNLRTQWMYGLPRRFGVKDGAIAIKISSRPPPRPATFYDIWTTSRSYQDARAVPHKILTVGRFAPGFRQRRMIVSGQRGTQTPSGAYQFQEADAARGIGGQLS